MKTSQSKGLIIVLGSPNSETGELYSIARDRCERAYAEYLNTNNYKILLTGGFGTHFNTTEHPHAFYLKKYLIGKGIPETDFVECVQSKNSLEDAFLSRPIVIKYDIKDIIVITSDYHFLRAKYIFENVYFELDVRLVFSVCKTDEKTCEIDLKSLKKHEKEALQKLKSDNYFNSSFFFKKETNHREHQEVTKNTEK